MNTASTVFHFITEWSAAAMPSQLASMLATTLAEREEMDRRSQLIGFCMVATLAWTRLDFAMPDWAFLGGTKLFLDVSKLYRRCPIVFLRKMGYAECNITMESRIAFCPRSSSMLTQSIVKDHMVSHYKKVYSAKDNDQIRQERLRRGCRPQSASSLSRGTAEPPAHLPRLSVQYDDSRYLYSRSSSVSSPGFSSSFHAKEIVYPSYTVDSDMFSHHIRPASEIKYSSPEATSHRRQSAYSMGASGDHSHYTSFQDPVQKTYSGDLLQKHSQHFTQDKPFTPKTLNTKPKEYTQEFYEPSQGFHTEHEWSEEEFNGTYFSASRQQSRAHKSRDRDLFDSSSRGSLDGDKSSINKSLSAEEEELMYLEFISAVTEDILSKGHISDRFVMFSMNRFMLCYRHLQDGTFLIGMCSYLIIC
ncbi:hypothetical protein F7725_008163 [Dissostichus mawsoni]|uniref:Uncharacterized protein n=1 Tax=Dissostichus mawsoni TaxID=36200 RepID=A0A7J5Y6G8_DISMA|nr:hypothetical protein F7725_008163 [Dissostichus mawsoni]